MDLNEVSSRLAEIDKKIAAALEAVNADSEASPALQAAVKEFREKSEKTLADLDEASEPVREHIVELEQAGDSAKVVARAEENINDSVQRSILDAHADICSLKAKTEA